MKLRLLREHYQSSDNITWKPKEAFETEEEAKESVKTDYVIKIYKCDFCDKFHYAHKDENRHRLGVHLK
jgi:hypothetical protein